MKNATHYECKDGTLLERGVWHNFGDGNISVKVDRGRDVYAIRCDTTGEQRRMCRILPSQSDAIMMGLYYRKTPWSVARFNFGDDAQANTVEGATAAREWGLD